MAQPFTGPCLCWMVMASDEEGAGMLPLHRLMSVPEGNRDIDWVREGLQVAIELEWGTIPPYLYAWWSIDTRNDGDPDDVAGAFRRIVIEEMLHMSIACNLLA